MGLRFARSVVVTALVALSTSVGLLGTAQSATSVGEPVKETSAGPSAAAGYGKLPLSFEPNLGQASDGIDYLARAKGYSLALMGERAVIKPSSGSPVSLSLVGADARATARGEERLGGVVNYLVGNEANKWKTGIPTYGRVTYRDLYPGIDATYYGTQDGTLEYDFVVGPGADPSQVGLRFRGHERLRIAADGSLVVATDEGRVVQAAPVIYQQIDGSRRIVAGAYEIGENGTVGFRVGGYDRSATLVIDPVMAYSGLLGGGRFDRSYGMTVGSDGSAYVTGITASSNNFPTTADVFQGDFGGGDNDAFVTKISPDGSSIVYSTFLGGGRAEAGYAAAVGPDGSAVVTGRTTSLDFPLFAPMQSLYGGGSEDTFVTKLTPAGDAVVFSTYLGSTRSELGRAVAIHTNGDVLVTGFTSSAFFPVTAGAWDTDYADNRDGFVTRYTSTGAYVYSTFLGGPTEDQPRGVVTDTAGNALISGWTRGNGFPTTPDAFQRVRAGGNGEGFITKFTPLGDDLLYSTFYGGTNIDVFRNLAIDSSGAIYIAGRTNSLDFPVSANAFQQQFAGGIARDAVVVKLSPELGPDPIVYSTYYGGTRDDEARGIGVHPGTGEVSIAGVTKSRPDLPGVDNTYGGGISDAFATRLNATGSQVVWARYVGGAGADESWAMGTDSNGGTYLSGVSDSLDFPTTAGSFGAKNPGGNDAFLVKFIEGSSGLFDRDPPGPLDPN